MKALKERVWSEKTEPGVECTVPTCRGSERTDSQQKKWEAAMWEAGGKEEKVVFQNPREDVGLPEKGSGLLYYYQVDIEDTEGAIKINIFKKGKSY